MKKVTMEDVKKEMKKMNITGWSSMTGFTPAEHMAHLKEIKKIRQRRTNAAKQK